MNALVVMKNEGNALFQQQRFDEAIQVYTSVLEKLHDSDEAAAQLEAAVRLNRAWAWIQMSDGDNHETTLEAAEHDCNAVIEMDPSCVKAFYRRAIARERRGHWKLAMEDVVTMKRLEPANPAIAPLLERLQEEDNLTRNIQQCTINSDGITNTSTNSDTINEEAEKAWCALQAAESNLKKQALSMTRCRPKRRKEAKEAPIHRAKKGEISQKTDDLWESLRREEVTVIAKAFPRSK